MAAFDTIFPADSLEFCPQPGSTDIFVCGTYKLDENTQGGDSGQNTPAQHRRGQCLVFQLNSTTLDGEINFDKLDEFSLPAVLDMKWRHGPDSILAIADSEGCISLRRWDTQDRVLTPLETIKCADKETLCLSLDWSNRRMIGTDPGSLIVSLSNGSLCLLRPAEGSNLKVTDTWHAHDYEPWIAAWNYWDTNVIFSGGDDLKMKGWDIRQGFSEAIFTNKRFEAGVTSIQSHPNVEHVLAVGSYNNTVQLFDARKPLTPFSQVDVGGGAWRVKWHPSINRKHELLVACMHDGFKIASFNFEEPGEEGTIVKRFDSHQSLAYGVDWSFADMERKESVIGSCSFYDHAMRVWSG